MRACIGVYECVCVYVCVNILDFACDENMECHLV